MPSLRRRPIGLFTALVCTAVASIAPAQKPSEAAPRELGSWGGSAGPEAPSPAGFRIDFAEQEGLAAADPAGKAFTARRPGWRLLYDPRNGMLWRGYGPGIPSAPAGADAAAIRLAAETTAQALHAELELPGDAPVFRYAAQAGGIWYVSFEQRVQGVRVEDAGLTLRLDREGRLVMFGGRLLPVAGVAARGDLRPEDALFSALLHLRRSDLLGPSARAVPGGVEAIVHESLTGDGRAPAPAYRVRVSTEAPLGEWILYVDARSGEIREFWNDVRFIAGRRLPPHLTPRAARGRPHEPTKPANARATFTATATGLVHENVTPDQPAVSAPFSSVQFTVTDGASPPVIETTDATGSFSFAGGPGSASVASGLEGPWITTNNVAGAQAAYAASVAAGVPALAVVFDDTNSHQAERDAFFFGTRARDNVLLYNPSETLFNVALPANVNLAQTCNAYYNGTSINFFAAGGGCINTAYSDTVVEHEYGHHVTTTIYAAHGRSVPGHLGEGYSDLQAASCEDTNIIGAGFSGPGTLIRNLANTCQWPASCGSGVHARGRVVGGSVWDTRVQFAAAYGPAGKVQLDQYLYAHFHGAPLTETEAFLEFLVLDDDNANVADGTPNFTKFLAGFTTGHGVPCPIPLATITHAPLGPTANQLHAYEIHATATPVLGGTVSSASVVWSVNGGAPTVTPMTYSGFDWSAAIPVVAPPAAVEYYLVFADSSGAVTLHPTGAPSEKIVFRNYRPERFYFDDFEAAAGWTSAGTGQDDWNRQAPGNSAHAYDPPSAYSGVACAGNDLSSPGFNGLYRFSVDNSYTSPVVDCSGRTGVFLRYRRWLTVEDALYDQARIEVSIAGGPFVAVWQNVATAGGVEHHLDRAWIDHHVRLSAADGQANVRVRFRLTSDAGLEFGGWTIDDVSLDAVPADPILTATGPLTAGSTWTLGVGGQPGEPYALGLDLAAPGFFVPFVGTLAANPFGPTFLMLVAPGAGVVAPTGRSFLSLTVPPGITGYTLYGIAVVFPLDGSPLVIGNTSVTTFL